MLCDVPRVTKFKINWDGGEVGGQENGENVPPKRDPNQLEENSQVMPFFVKFPRLHFTFQSMEAPLKSTANGSSSGVMEID